MLDIGIAVAIALLLAVTAYLGTHLTMHPAETSREKLLYKSGFAVCGLVGCALIGVQTWRNNQTQDDLRGRLSRIEKNTKTPPTVQVNVPPPTVIFSPPTSQKSSLLPSPKPADRFVLTDDHARLALARYDIRTKPPAVGLISQPYVNVYFENRGKAPSVGWLTKIASMMGGGHELSDEQVNNILAQNSTIPKESLVLVDNNPSELYPTDTGDHFFTVPPNDNDPAAKTFTRENIDKASLEKDPLYLFITMIYRDRLMPAGTYGVTEACVFFFGPLDVPRFSLPVVIWKLDFHTTVS